jgi:hypothetical protein
MDSRRFFFYWNFTPHFPLETVLLRRIDDLAAAVTAVAMAVAAG